MANDKIFAGNAFKHREWPGVWEIYIDLATMEKYAMQGAPVNHGAAVVPLLMHKESRRSGNPYIEVDTYKLEYWKKKRDGDQQPAEPPAFPENDDSDDIDDVPF